MNNSWGDQDGSDSVYIQEQHSFLKKTEAKILVPNWSIQLDFISQHIKHTILNEDDVNERQTGEREEWMCLADLTSNCDSKNDKTTTVPDEYWKMG